jgi:hypothetical protein
VDETLRWILDYLRLRDRNRNREWLFRQILRNANVAGVYAEFVAGYMLQSDADQREYGAKLVNTVRLKLLEFLETEDGLRLRTSRTRADVQMYLGRRVATGGVGAHVI